MLSRPHVRRFARFVGLGSIGLLIQDKFHGLSLGDWAVAAWIVLGLSLVALLFTEERLRPRRPTFHFARSDSGVLSISIRPPEKPRRGKKKKKEIEIGLRAIEVSQRVLAAVARANGKMVGFPLDHENWDARNVAYQQTLHELQAEVGAEWRQVLVDLEALDDAHPWTRYEISVTYTGLDTYAIEVEATGRDLLRKHGVDPPGEAV